MCAMFLDGVTEEVCQCHPGYENPDLAHELFIKAEAELPSRRKCCLMGHFEHGSMLCGIASRLDSHSKTASTSMLLPALLFGIAVVWYPIQ